MIVLPIKILLVSNKNWSYDQLYLHFLLYPLFYKQSKHCFECTAVMIETFITWNTDLKLIQISVPWTPALFLNAKDPQLVIAWKFQIRKELVHSAWHRQSSPVDYSGIILRNKGCGPETLEISYQNHILWRLVVTDSKSDVFLLWERWWLQGCACKFYARNV